jgi:prepilin-type N-terminal cleavage/methylation domain-containing protein
MRLIDSITKAKRHHGGFSLIELMVTMAIVILVTGISLARYGSFNNSVLLKSQAYELALDIRQTQLYGVSVTSQTGDFNSPFGIVFTENSNSYVLFQDDGDYVFESGEQVGESYTIDPRFEITGLTTSCGSASTVSTLTIVFERPDFDAIMRGPGCGGATSAGITISAVADASVLRTVIIRASGLISVQ